SYVRLLLPRLRVLRSFLLPTTLHSAPHTPSLHDALPILAGTFGDRIIELVACWTIIMLISGLFLWFPKAKEKIKGVFTIRFNKAGRIRRRDLHAVPAFWISGGLLFFLLSGMLWTGFWGTGVQQLTTASGAGYPP